MAKRKASKKYGRKASQKVERAMHEMKRGELRSGRSGRKVKSRKQAIAIGLSEARSEGGKTPPPPKRKKTARKSKTARKRSGGGSSRGKSAAGRSGRGKSSRSR